MDIFAGIKTVIKTVAPVIVKSVLFQNVDNDVKEISKGPLAVASGKPWWLTRRFWGGVLVVLGPIYAYLTGQGLPIEEILQVVDGTANIYEVAIENQGMLISTWGAMLATWGKIRKK